MGHFQLASGITFGSLKEVKVTVQYSKFHQSDTWNLIPLQESSVSKAKPPLPLIQLVELVQTRLQEPITKFNIQPHPQGPTRSLKSQLTSFVTNNTLSMQSIARQGETLLAQFLSHLALSSNRGPAFPVMFTGPGILAISLASLYLLLRMLTVQRKSIMMDLDSSHLMKVENASIQSLSRI